MIMKSAKPKLAECFYARKSPFLALLWKKKKSKKNPCLMLPTGSRAQMINHTCSNGQIKELTKIVSLHDQNMGGVDLLDQIVHHAAGERPFLKFWKKFFFFSSSTAWHFVHTYCMSKTPKPNKSSHISGLCLLWWRSCVLHL